MEHILALFNFKTLILAAIIFIPIEHLIPMHAEQKLFRKGWIGDVIYAVLNSVIIGAGLLAVAIGAVVMKQSILPTSVSDFIGSQPIWLQVIELFIIADLFFYLVHRLFHTIPALWRFHAIHHSIEEMDWLAAHRVHPVDQILTKGASIVPCYFLGFSDWAILIYFAIYQWHSLALHANINISLGPLSWLVASPEFHHWHHTNRREAYDKNFAGQFPLWDVIFGTAHMPADARPGNYGVDDELPKGYVDQFFHPFKRKPADRPDNQPK